MEGFISKYLRVTFTANGKLRNSQIENEHIKTAQTVFLYKTGVNLLISVNDLGHVVRIHVCRKRDWPSKVSTDQYHMTVSYNWLRSRVFFKFFNSIGSQGSSPGCSHRYSVHSWDCFLIMADSVKAPFRAAVSLVGKRVLTSVLYNSYCSINLIIDCSQSPISP